MKSCLARRYDVTADGEEVVRELGLPQTQLHTLRLVTDLSGRHRRSKLP